MVKVWGNLVRDVVEPDFCIGCGSCIGTCPVNALERVNEKPALTGVCINCGICYGACPEAADPRSMQVPVFGAPANDDLLGTFTQGLSVEAKDPSIKARGQNGGAVTSILGALLENGYIDAAIVTGIEGIPWYPVVRVATNSKELMECAGTKYSHGPVSLGLKDAIRMYYRKNVAFVGTPCQIFASRRLASSKPRNEHMGDAIKLRVGLFCSGVFKYQTFFKKVIEKDLRVPLTEVAKFEMKEDKFLIYLKHKPSQELPSSTTKRYIDLPCKLCHDFTARLADISVGAAGSPAGRSTVLVRTPIGEEAFAIARNSHNLDVVDLAEVRGGVKRLRQEAEKKRETSEKTVSDLRRGKKILPIWLQEPSIVGYEEPVESDKGICPI